MKLLRPYTPIPVRIKVVQRQLLRFDVAAPDREKGERQDVYLDRLLGLLSTLMDALFEPLQLDHDPALVNRKKIFRNGKHVGYSPAANNPDYLIYRTKAAHDIKTRVRGDGAQYSDLALARKNKRIEKRRAKKEHGRPKSRKLPSLGLCARRRRPQSAGATKPVLTFGLRRVQRARRSAPVLPAIPELGRAMPRKARAARRIASYDLP